MVIGVTNVQYFCKYLPGFLLCHIFSHVTIDVAVYKNRRVVMLAQRREVVSEGPSDRLTRVSQGLPSDRLASDRLARVSLNPGQGLPGQARVSLHPRSRSTSGRWGWRRKHRD